jgi:hypothetical protein
MGSLQMLGSRNQPGQHPLPPHGRGHPSRFSDSPTDGTKPIRSVSKHFLHFSYASVHARPGRVYNGSKYYKLRLLTCQQRTCDRVPESADFFQSATIQEICHAVTTTKLRAQRSPTLCPAAPNSTRHSHSHRISRACSDCLSRTWYWLVTHRTHVNLIFVAPRLAQTPRFYSF